MKPDRLLLDTHVWLWLALGVPGTIKPALRKAIERAGESTTLFVSILSVWEIAMLESKGRLILPMTVEEWIERALARPEITLLGLTQPRTAIDSCRLPGTFHADPADRLLVATARSENAALVTRDRKILDYAATGHVRVLAA